MSKAAAWPGCVENRMFFDELSNDEWAQLAALVSDEPAVRLNRRGRPRAEPRIVANAVLWILTTGEPWSKLPGRYPSGPTCRRRFEEWQVNGTLAEMVRLLSQTGRTFVYVPQASPPAAAANPVPQLETVSVRDDSLRGVSWKSPESWQTPANATRGWPSLDPLADMTRQLSGTVPPDVGVRTEPAVSRAAELGAVPRRCDHPLDAPQRPLPMSLAARGMQVVDRRGYVIYVAAERVPSAMYRAWAEIELDGRRVERSGLVGPRFADPDGAQEYALEWARQWIDRQYRTVGAAANVATVANVAGAASAASVAAAAGYSRPLPATRTMPNVPTVSSAAVHADAPPAGQARGQAGQMSGAKNGQAADSQLNDGHVGQAGIHAQGHHLSGSLGGPINGPINGPISGPLGGPLNGPINGQLHGPLHGPISALRAPLRRYPSETPADSSTSERFPMSSELISHAG
jgi:transposase